MAVKNHPSELRRGEVGREAVIKYAQDLERLAMRLRSLGADMDKFHLQSVRTDGVTKIVRGIKLLEEFVPNLDRAIANTK
jgi:hypothetical protein